MEKFNEAELAPTSPELDHATIEEELLNVTRSRLNHGNLAGATEALSWSSHLDTNVSLKNNFQEFLDGKHIFFNSFKDYQILSGGFTPMTME